MRWAALYRPPPILGGVSASEIRTDRAANQAWINARYGPALPSWPREDLWSPESRPARTLRQLWPARNRKVIREPPHIRSPDITLPDTFDDGAVRLRQAVKILNGGFSRLF